MIMAKGNLFDDTVKGRKVDAICITSNGYYTLKNEAVMGRGVALQAKKKWPFIQKKLGYMLSLHGPHVYMISKKKHIGNSDRIPYHVVNFPVKWKSGIAKGRNVVARMRKRFPEGSIVPGFMLKASLKLIQRSARELAFLAKARGWKTVVLPMPGCGAGELDWPEVKAVLKPILKGRRFIVVKMED